ncbi:MAG: TonB-dependent receptor [Xanthobacteraceae bacterium]|nr:TonB-dependent receptor [Xanthobacteraceae bacterium]
MGEVTGLAGRMLLAGIAFTAVSWPVQAQQILPLLTVTASRLGIGIPGTATSVITAEEIARSPSHSLQDILAREPGIQVQNLFGGIAGARSVVDMRGFGAAAASNTLVLVNGRRLNDIDIAAIDLAAIPPASIERIEVIRGNSGAVLYGDGAVGGVINIITKTGAGAPPSARVAGTAGSFNHREGAISGQGAMGPFSFSAHGNFINTDGYRVNNELAQRNGVGEVRYTTEQGSAYLTLTGDEQHLGLPGGRRVAPGINQLVTDRRGAATPFDFADKQGFSATGGVTRRLAPGLEAILDAGLRRKDQQAGFFSATGFPFTYVDTTLTTMSVTPRVVFEGPLLGLRSRVLAGVDYYDTSYDSDRSQFRGAAPIHVYDLGQSTFAGYWQQSVALLPTTDVSFGARLQRNTVTARDRYDPTAPGAFDVQGLPLDKSETQHALHAGLEHRFTDAFAVFARAARSFRLPNVDERVAMNPFLVPTSFDLKTQTSRDVEAGVRVEANGFRLQSSAYLMELTNELHFSPATFTNVNLDPTRRTGVETLASWQVTDTVRLRGGVAYTRAVFREGAFAGNDVPLVSRWTGSAGVSWDIWQKWLVLDVGARFIGPRRLDNDQANVQPQIPAHAVVDLRLGGQIDHFVWSIAVQNLLDADYFDYGIASAFALNTYNAYPQPGRTFLVRAGLVY